MDLELLSRIGWGCFSAAIVVFGTAYVCYRLIQMDKKDRLKEKEKRNV